MLEASGVLRTWRLNSIPHGDQTVQAEPISDHRVAYLEYEGPVSGDRGVVRREDTGTFELQAESADAVVVLIDGQKLNGRLEILREGDCWICRLTK